MVAQADSPARIARFGLSEPAEASAALPEDVERALRDDELLFECFHDPETGVVAFDRAWFVVTRRDFDGDGRKDWIVRTDQPCLRRNGTGLWWLYQEMPEHEEWPAGRRLLVRTHAARLDLYADRHWSFPDIVVQGGAGGDHRLQYDGAAYVEEATLAERPDPFADLLGALYGEWQPSSRAYLASGVLVLHPGRLSWSQCEDAPYRVLEAEVGTAMIELDDTADCRIVDTLVSVLDLTLYENDCQLEVSLYDSAQAAQDGARSSQGFFFNPDCHPNPEE